MERAKQIYEITDEQLRLANQVRGRLAIASYQIAHRDCQGVYGQQFAEYDITQLQTAQDAVPYDVVGQQLLPIELSE